MSWPTRLGATLVALFVALAVFGPWLAPHSAEAIDLAHAFEGPSARHLLGTGDNGVDLLSALLHGARLAGLVALSAVGLSALIGTALGTLAGYVGGRVDHGLGALMDLVQSFPAILLHITLLALVERPTLVTLVVALVLPGWVLYARLARAEALVLRNAEFVQAARALGASPTRVLRKHVVPSLLSPIVIQGTGGLGGVVLAEATLSFLGLGPSGASWGALLDQGSGVLLRFPHAAFAPGMAIGLSVLGFALAGDALRDWMAINR